MNERTHNRRPNPNKRKKDKIFLWSGGETDFNQSLIQSNTEEVEVETEAGGEAADGYNCIPDLTSLISPRER